VTADLDEELGGLPFLHLDGLGLEVDAGRALDLGFLYLLLLQGRLAVGGRRDRVKLC